MAKYKILAMKWHCGLKILVGMHRLIYIIKIMGISVYSYCIGVIIILLFFVPFGT